jgi:hypothetical protein
MKPKQIIIGVLFLVVIVGLFMWGNALKGTNLVFFEDTDVACLSAGHQNLAFHIHPRMVITVDGQNEVLPANIGINAGCMSEVHTHDATGEIHVESFRNDRLTLLNLRHFFDVWGVTPEREGYTLEIYFQGERKNSVDEIPFVDLSLIELKYTKLP